MAIEDNLNRQIVHGINWSVSSRFVIEGMRLIFGVSLARLLSPTEFGLFGMILVFKGFANLFTDIGFGAALIQKSDAREDHYTSAFWASQAAGLLTMVVFMLGAPILADFYDEPILRPLTIIISLNFVCGSLKVVHISQLRKSLAFRKLAIIETTSTVVAGSVAVVLAILGFGVWSLVWQTIVETATAVIILWSMHSWRPTLSFNRSALAELWRFSVNVMASDSISYWSRNADKLLVGRVLGTSALGVYSKCYSFMLLPLNLITRRISQVLFPAFSVLQEDKRRVGEVYLRTTRIVALLIFPVMITSALMAHDLVPAILGPKWLGMIPILRVFCLIATIQCLTSLTGSLYRSQARTDLQFRVGLVLNLVNIGAIIVGLRWGIMGVAVAYSLFTILTAYPAISIPIRLVGLSFRELLSSLVGVAGCTGIMGLVVWQTGALLPESWPHIARVCLQQSVALSIFFALCHFFRVAAYSDLRSVILNRQRS